MDVWNIFNSQEKTSIDDTIVAGYGNTVSKTIYCKKPVFWIRIQIGSVPVPGTYWYLLRTFVDLNQYRYCGAAPFLVGSGPLAFEIPSVSTLCSIFCLFLLQRLIEAV